MPRRIEANYTHTCMHFHASLNFLATLSVALTYACVNNNYTSLLMRSRRSGDGAIETVFKPQWSVVWGADPGPSIKGVFRYRNDRVHSEKKILDHASFYQRHAYNAAIIETNSQRYLQSTLSNRFVLGYA